MDVINAKANTYITLSHHFNDEIEYHQNLNKQKRNQTYKQKMKGRIKIKNFFF
jgi:hypothetical protein